MTTITIDLPDPLVNELKKRNVSGEELNSVVQKMLKRWLVSPPEHQTEPVPSYTPVKLAGLWKDLSICEEDINEARRSMWAGFGESTE